MKVQAEVKVEVGKVVRWWEWRKARPNIYEYLSGAKWQGDMATSVRKFNKDLAIWEENRP